jgi:hypothetical protein
VSWDLVIKPLLFLEDGQYYANQATAQNLHQPY